MFKSLGPMELGIILLIVVMIFGVGKLPEIGSAIGKSIRAFKKSQDNDEEETETTETPEAEKHKAIKKKTAKTTSKAPVDDKTQSA